VSGAVGPAVSCSISWAKVNLLLVFFFHHSKPVSCKTMIHTLGKDLNPKQICRKRC
jgi:hypothetical protein